MGLALLSLEIAMKITDISKGDGGKLALSLKDEDIGSQMDTWYSAFWKARYGTGWHKKSHS